MTSRKSLGRLAAAVAAVAAAVTISGCALPPIVTVASFAADIFSLSGTGKTVSDHGISLVMQQDCALFRVFGGQVCSDYAPAEDTPMGALVALNPLVDPSVNPNRDDPMTLPHALAYLDGSLGLAVASATAGTQDLTMAAFAGVRAERRAAREGGAPDGLAYLAAGIGG